MTIYRKIYEQHFGPIPKDEEGRTYEIHHIDGNHENNDPSNLKAVSIQEHYDIHYNQGDWSACLIISERMKITPEEKSNLAKLNAEKRVENGTHPFLGGALQEKRLAKKTHNFIGLQEKLVEEGRHHFLSSENQRKWVNERIEKGTHHWLSERHKKECQKRSDQLIKNGNHNFQKLYKCDCGCKKTYNIGNFTQHQNKLKKLNSITNV